MAVNIINTSPNETDISQLTRGHGGKKGSKPFMMKNLLDAAEIAQGTVYVSKKSQKIKGKIVVSESEESQVAQNGEKMEKSKQSAEKHSESDSDFVDTYV